MTIRRLNNSTKYFISILAAFLFYQCNINEPVAPRWDITLNVPIVNKSYTLYDIIEKKSSELQHFTEGADKNLLYYTDVKNLDKIEMSDKLKLDNFQGSSSEKIGPISVAGDSIQTEIGYDWVGVPASPGTNAILPAVSNAEFPVNFSSIEEFKSAIINSGIIDIDITNYFPAPVNLTINNLQIIDGTTNTTIINLNDPIVINSSQTTKVQNIAIDKNTTIGQNLVLYCSISSTGSGGQTITLPQNTFSVNAKLKDVEVLQATAKIPEQDPVEMNGSLSLDEGAQMPTMFQKLTIEGGTYTLTLKNNIDVDAVADVTVPTMKTPQGQIFGTTVNIPAKQTVIVFDHISLSNYTMESVDGDPTNSVKYEVTFQPLASTDYRTLNSEDRFSGIADVTGLKVRSFTGILKPTEIEETRTAVALDFQDLQNKFNFQKVILKNPLVELRLKPTANLEFSINGRMEAQNSLGQRSVMTLSSKTLDKTLITPTDTIITMNPDSVSAFFQKFSKFPDSLVVYAGGTVNPNYKSISVKNTDFVTSSSKMELPLYFGIIGGELSDSVAVELSDDDRDNIKDLNSFSASLNITNGIPADVSFTGRLYDASNNYLMTLHSDQDSTITIKGAQTNSSGDVTTKTTQVVNIFSESGEADKLSQAQYMRVNMNFNTTGDNGTPVKFKTDDTIEFSATGSIIYSVKK